MRIPSCRSARVTAFCCLAACLGLAQVTASAQSSARADKQRTIERQPARAFDARTGRFVLSVGAGLLPTFVNDGRQIGLPLSASAQYFLNERLGVGLTVARSTAESEPFVDDHGVRSWLTASFTNVAARCRGTIVGNRHAELYGGIQLGANLVATSQRHEFPEEMAGTSPADYIAARVDPFGEPRTGVSAVGFFGVAAHIAKPVGVYVEVGNNLSLLQGGLEVTLGAPPRKATKRKE